MTQAIGGVAALALAFCTAYSSMGGFMAIGRLFVTKEVPAAWLAQQHLTEALKLAGAILLALMAGALFWSALT